MTSPVLFKFLRSLCYTIPMAGKIFLSGGGDENATKFLDELFFREIPQGGNILFIATGFRDTEKYAHALEWMHDVLLMHKRPDVLFYLANDLNNVDRLDDYSAVYIAGGDTDAIMDEFDHTGFEFVLANYVRIGGTVYGGGAGAIVLGKYIDTRRDVRRKFKTGADLLGRYSVFPGYRQEIVDGWVPAHNSHLLCLPDGIGVVMQDGKIIADAGKSYRTITS